MLILIGVLIQVRQDGRRVFLEILILVELFRWLVIVMNQMYSLKQVRSFFRFYQNQLRRQFVYILPNRVIMRHSD